MDEEYVEGAKLVEEIKVEWLREEVEARSERVEIGEGQVEEVLT